MLGDRIGSLPVPVVAYIFGVTTAILNATASFLGNGSLPLLVGIFLIAGF